MKVIQLFRNEKKLIQQAARNEREAQQLLYEKYSGKMLSVCRQYIRDLQHAEEVMLNGFFKVFRHLGDYRYEGSFEGWIRRIMIREAISFLRRKQHLEFPDEEIEASAAVSDVMGDQLNAAHIQSLIDALPEGYRAVFVLYAIEGYKHAEISEMLEISEGTSKSQLFKARRLLQQQLRAQNQSDYGI